MSKEQGIKVGVLGEEKGKEEGVGRMIGGKKRRKKYGSRKETETTDGRIGTKVRGQKGDR